MKIYKFTIAILSIVIVLLLGLLGAILFHYEVGEGCYNQISYQCSVTGNPFSSEAELKAWLAKSEVDRQPFIWGTYDCDDFAVELVREAWGDGYQMGLAIVRDESSEYTHMNCWTAIGNVIYLIEPQGDNFIRWAYQPNFYEDNWQFFGGSNP